MSITPAKFDRSDMRRLMGVQVLATGSYVPDEVVTNEDLASSLGFDAQWIIERTGVQQRRRAPVDMATSDLAAEAARRCMKRAGVGASDVDLLLVATATPDAAGMPTACLVQDQLGLRTPAVDLAAACAGFMYALVTGMHFVSSGSSRMALVIGADCMSRILNPHDPKSYPLFGDGAGAVLLTPGDAEQGLASYCLGADGSGHHLLTRPMGGSRMPPDVDRMNDGLQYLHMDGRAVFKWAVQILTNMVPPILEHGGVTADELDLIVMHQANLRILVAAADALGLDKQKMIINLDRFGNTTSGSLPLALDDAFSEGRVKRGDKLLFAAFGGGLSWGAGVFRW